MLCFALGVVQLLPIDNRHAVIASITRLVSQMHMHMKDMEEAAAEGLNVGLT